MTKRIPAIIFFGLALTLAAVVMFAPVPAMAQVQISASLPGPNTVTPGSGTAPGALIGNFYQYALSIAGILALGVVVFGGIKYMISVGNPSNQTDAKEWIEAALLGIVLLAGAYLILRVINPSLVNLSLPGLQGVGSQAQTTAQGVLVTGTGQSSAQGTLNTSNGFQQ